MRVWVRVGKNVRVKLNSPLSSPLYFFVFGTEFSLIDIFPIAEEDMLVSDEVPLKSRDFNIESVKSSAISNFDDGSESSMAISGKSSIGGADSTSTISMGSFITI